MSYTVTVTHVWQPNVDAGCDTFHNGKPFERTFRRLKDAIAAFNLVAVTFRMGGFLFARDMRKITAMSWQDGAKSFTLEIRKVDVKNV